MVVRKILLLDEEKCNGCGLCIPACAEGALAIVNGKVKLVSERLCDGLGACIGECPQGAISIEEREAEKFDEEAVERHLKTERAASTSSSALPVHESCPSVKAMKFGESLAAIQKHEKSTLSHWPVQLALVPTNAPFLNDAKLVVAADCVPFAYANFHADFLRGKALLIGCPKLDNAQAYEKKLTEIFRKCNIKEVKVINMEVPCCFGLYNLVERALKSSGKRIPIHRQIISIKGDQVIHPPQMHDAPANALARANEG